MTAEAVKRARRTRRIVLVSVLTLLALYFGSYVILSVTGGYVVSESGELRIGLLAASDIFVWQPRYGWAQRFRQIDGQYGFRGDSLGLLFYPLILVDQKWCHPTTRFLTQGAGFVKPFPAPSPDDYHPLLENPFHGRFPYRPAEEERSVGATDRADAAGDIDGLAD
ncbi:MAG: hypothetical protein ACYTFI_14860 [Planctomycetota bacterium]|jgi:hypothetical protein